MTATVADLGPDRFGQALAGPGIGVRLGPFNAHIAVPVRRLAEPLFGFYSAYPLLEGDAVYHFRVKVEEVRRKLRPWRPLARFTVDGQLPHEDLPANQAWPALEWGINLVIALRAHAFLILHTAVVAKNGAALLLPAAPGFGKTTLCTALAHRGWRLLSDEFGLVRPGTSELVPVPRPMALKNESIEVIRQFAPEAVIGPETPDTRKGTVAHVRPPDDAIAGQDDPATARWIIFPRWVAGAELSLQPMSRADGFMTLASNAFNYEVLGERGFDTARNIVGGADCLQLVYSDLDEAVHCIDRLSA